MMEAATLRVMPEASATRPRPVWEEEEFAALYREHSQAIFYLALRFLGDETRAEDAAHDVFLKAFQNMATFRGESGIRTWLYRITINHCRNLAQTWHQRNIVCNSDDALWDRTEHHDHPLKVIEAKELSERIQRTLDALPEEYRLLLLLVADEKMSYEEVAVVTEQTADSVRGKLHRARKAFQTHFEKTA